MQPHTDVRTQAHAHAHAHSPAPLQISRWDRLKGWKSLLQAWVLLKTHSEEFSTQLSGCTPSEANTHDSQKHLRMLRSACLVLAGPEPASIVDDPEGTGCLQVRAPRPPSQVVSYHHRGAALSTLNPAPPPAMQELKAMWDALPIDVQRDGKIVELPMGDVIATALIENSIQEGEARAFVVWGAWVHACSGH